MIQEIEDDDSRAKEDYDVDHSLLTWKKWAELRTKQTKTLGDKVIRPPADLAMNLLEKVREDKERKTALEYAQLIRTLPTVRDTPFEQPLRLKQECPCKPVYEIKRTPCELGRPPVIEHIGVPEYIQVTEKGLTGIPQRQQCKVLDYDYEKYRDKRENELKKKILKVDPHRPDIANLMVKGNKPKPPPPKIPPLPMISIIVPTLGPGENLSAAYVLRINNTVIYKDIEMQDLSYIKEMQQADWHEKCHSWAYYFNNPVKRAGRSKLYIENLGTVTIRYCWKKIRKQIPFIPDDIYEQVFFFNKNEDVLSPGQRKEIFITFISDKPGIYSESWEFSPCNVSFDAVEKLVINLNADAVETIKYTNKKVDKIKRKINRKAIYLIVRNIVGDAIDNATAIVPETYPYKKLFLEAEMFVLKNPVCFYHQTEVGKMNQMYQEMNPKQKWDLSISSWRESMMAKEFEERMYYYEMLRISHSDLLKPWYEGEDVKSQKYRAMQLLLGQLADKFDKEYDLIVHAYNKNIINETGLGEKSMSRLDLVTVGISVDQARNIFYLRMYEHVATAMELCAGVLSSIDLNRWIEFDFCRW